MERAWLERQLAAGRSIEAIAREVGRHPSTVAYWVKQHGLASSHAARYAARGALDRELLHTLVDAGRSTRQIASDVGRSQATVRHWLREYGLRTARARPPRVQDVREAERTCPTHGLTTFAAYSPGDHLRCVLCRRQRVADRRRRVKAILVAEAGGRCALCGYDRCDRALRFHHNEPGEKAFGLALRGVARSLERCRAETRKCTLLCANCHAEVEAGVARLPLAGEAMLRDHPAVAQRGEHGPG
jgi:transposase